MKRVFLDENVDAKLAVRLSNCEVRSVRTEEWFGVLNGELLRRIEAGFDVLISHDRGLEHQQKWAGRALGLIIIRSESTDIASYEVGIPDLLRAINQAQPGVVTTLMLKPILRPETILAKDSLRESPNRECLCCAAGLPTEGPRTCPECGHVFAGNGWDGIDAHWRSHHEDVMSYEQFRDSLCRAHGLSRSRRR